MRILVSTLSFLLLATASFAHVGVHPSVHDTVAGIVERMRSTLPPETLTTMKLPQVVEFLTEEEKEILGKEHIVFTTNVPVVVSVIKDVRIPGEPFWLDTRGFVKAEGVVETTDEKFEIWQKEFEAGEIGLGVPSLTGGGDHYFIAIAPKEAGAAVELKDIYPGQLRPGVFKTGERVYVGWDDSVIKAAPASLDGQVLLRTDMDDRRDAKLTDIFRMTPYPSTNQPDQIVLTWSNDPQKTQAIQWRTSTEVSSGAVRYQKKGTTAWQEVQAATEVLENVSTVNDPVIHRHTARLRGLEPATAYSYEVSLAQEGEWKAAGTFTTAPSEVVPFKFVYMGDAQNGLEAWGNLLHKAHESEPEAAFYIMAGDLVNRGNERDDWDLFFKSAEGVYENKQLIPAIGNHENQGNMGPWMYLSLFDLPQNGPKSIEKERAYSYTYSNALFIVLDSNLEPATQTEWLEEQLKNSDATWKFLVYHHPLYSAGPRRDNPELRDVWGPIFDKYHVDIALQGHDHSYLRTYPMKDAKKVGSAAEGTIYIISVSGTKFYEQADHEYTEVGFTNIPTYQLLDIQIDGNKLTYKAYDIDGNVKDEFIIEK